MSTLSTHALDTATGRPASGLRLMLEKQEQPEAWRAYCHARAEGTEPTGPKPAWTTLARGVTNSDGRCPELLPTGTQLAPGIYRMDFDTAGYLNDRGQSGFYPIAQIIFEITADNEHYHIPLLLSPFGFSTYRGS